MPTRMSLALALAPLLLAGLGSPATGQDRLAREASAQASRADALFKSGRYAAAMALYRAEQSSRKAIGDVRYEAYAHRGVGCCLVRLGEDRAAIPAFEAAGSLDAGRDDPGFEG